MRAARATSWAEFSQAEVDAMTPSMRHAMTTRFATQAAAAAKAKARAEAEEIAREVSRRKKAEHDAKVAEAAMDNIKKEAAKLRRSWKCLPLSRRRRMQSSSATSASSRQLRRSR